MKRLVWKTNAADPYKLDYYQVIALPGESRIDAIQRERRFWDGLEKGLPQATGTFSVEELVAMGVHGLYASEEDSE